MAGLGSLEFPLEGDSREIPDAHSARKAVRLQAVGSDAEASLLHVRATPEQLARTTRGSGTRKRGANGAIRTSKKSVRATSRSAAHESLARQIGCTRERLIEMPRHVLERAEGYAGGRHEGYLARRVMFDCRHLLMWVDGCGAELNGLDRVVDAELLEQP